MKKNDIINAISSKYGDIYLHSEYLPEAYCENIENVKAVVLGCDPSNKNGEKFSKAFGLDKTMKYFTNINRNLEKIGLCKSEVYIDNLCKNYFTKETYDNERLWLEIANKFWTPYLKDELDKLFPLTIPVLVTSDILLETLCYKGCYHKTKNEIYYRECIHIKANQNKLERNLIPLFRHYKYSLRNWVNYTDYVKKLLQN